jgi:membrane protease YdiL (CAAX protease family)
MLLRYKVLMSVSQYRELMSFFSLVAAAGAVATLILWVLRSEASPGAAALVAGANVYAPGIIALALFWRHRTLGQLVPLLKLRSVPARGYVCAILLLPLINIVSILVHRAVEGSQADLPAEAITTGLTLLPIFLFSSFAEELAWRGYALPRLQRFFNPVIASLILGAFWALWHLPLFLVPGSVQASVPFGLYLIYVPALSVIFTALFNWTGGSLVIVTLLHASLQISNVVIGILPAHSGDERPYQISVLLTVAAAAVAIRFTRARPVSAG